MAISRILKAVCTIAIVGLLASCAAAPVASVGSFKETESIELTVWLFPGTGMEELIEKYEAGHPELKINIQTAQYLDVHNNLQTAFAAGVGAPDICLVEVSYIEKFKKLPEFFHNLYDYGANGVQSDFLDWKWQQAQNPDRTFLFGLPTDIGPLALAYRKDLFRQAGLPYERDEVSRLMATWDDYLRAGQLIEEKTGAKMVNNLKLFYRMMFSQLEEQYFEKVTGRLIIDENPSIRKAWDYAMNAAELGLSANIEAYMPEWGAGMEQGTFAMMPAPAWMTGFIRSNAPAAFGKWDIASLPPQQFANWGGSFLTLPMEGRHPQEAFDLIRYLTAPEQQLQIFLENGNFPSTPGIYDNPSISGKTDPYFSGAPVGKMYSEAAERVKPIYEGPLSQVVATALDDVLQLVDSGLLEPEQAWAEGLEQVRRSLRQYGEWQ